MANLVADSAFDMVDFIANGSLGELFEFGGIITATSTTFAISYSFGDTTELLTLSGVFADYVDGYPTSGTISDATFSLNGVSLFRYSSLSMAVTQFIGFVQADDIAQLFQTLSSGADRIIGSVGRDVLLGYDGDDTISGEGGDDTVEGGAGDDTLLGQDGNDVLRGGLGSDQLYGGAGNDFLSEYSGDNGPFGNDLYDGGEGIDRVSLFTAFGPGVTVDLRLETAQNTGSMGTDTFVGIEHITANYGNDTLTGNEAANWFWTFSGTDILSGNGGNDFFTVGQNDKTADGGEGVDTIAILDLANQPAYTAAGVTVSLALQGTAQATGVGNWTLSNMENVGGSWGADRLTGDANANILAGHLGNDTLTGGDGNDTLAGDGTWAFANGAAAFVAIAVDGPGGNDVLDGGAGDDLLIGGGGDDVLRGGLGSDQLFGGAGNDFLSEASGDNGPFGNDLYDGGAGNDRVSLFTAFGPGVTVDLRVATPQNTGSMGTDTFVGIEHITANYGNDTLIGNEAANWFWTFAGTDNLSGNGGDDYFTVGYGDKIVAGGEGNDTIEISDTAFQPLYAAGGIAVSLALQGTAQATAPANASLGNWTLTSIENLGGSWGADRLTGDANANILAGAEGSDTLIGGAGDDTLSGDGTFALDANSAPAFFDIPTVPNWVFGNDVLEGDDGNDLLSGGGGNDILRGGSGTDILRSGTGSDQLQGGSGADIFDYASAAGSINGDTIIDLNAEDRIDFRFNTANANGGFLIANFIGAAAFSGVAGQYRYVVSGPTTLIQLDSNGDSVADQVMAITNGRFALGETEAGSNILKIIGTSGTSGIDTLTGTLADDSIYAQEGNDTINASQGNDYVDGGAGTDRLIFNTFNATRFAAATGARTFTITDNAVLGSNGTITTGFASIERILISTIGGGDFNDIFDASGFVSSTSNALDIRLGNGSNQVLGSNGADIITTGLGNNVIDAGAGLDTVVVNVDNRSSATTFVTSENGAVITTQGGFQTGRVTNAEFVRVQAGISINTVRVDASGYVALPGVQLILNGHNGTDIFIGSTGSDIFGNTTTQILGDDVFTGNGGADIFDYTFATDSIDRDTIADFDADDVIDFQFNNNVGIGGSGLLCNKFIGADAFHGIAGEYRYQIAGNQTLVQVDTNGDSVADQVLTIANGAFRLVETAPGSNQLVLAAAIDPLAGIVADGYVEGATLFIDTNGNKLLDSGEAWTVTGPGGTFSLNVNQAGSLVAVGGINADTGLANTMTMIAPSGAGVVNPLTTLIAAVVEAGNGATSLAAAQAQVKQALGLDPTLDLLTLDLLGQGDNPAALAAQKAAAMIANLVATTLAVPGAATGSEAILLGAIADLVTFSGTVDLTNTTTLTSLLTEALPGVANIAVIASDVAVESTSIAAATSIAGVGKAQSEAQLTGNELANIITGSQADDVISGLAGDDTLSGLGGNDTLRGGAGSDHLTGGAGNDIFSDTAAGLNGDTLTDFAIGDKIVIGDASLASFSFSLSGSTLTYTGGSVTLAGVSGNLIASAIAGGGVQLRLADPTRNDFNGDGYSDILWRNDNGTLTNWLGQADGGFVGNYAAGVLSLPDGWTVIGTGDFNGDGRSDVLWRHANGTVTDWLAQANGNFQGNYDNAAYGVDASWKTAGTGDFNGDGRSDVLWRNDDGGLTSWSGTASGGFAGGGAIYQVGADWHVAGTGDFNGDGRGDILWRNANGTLTNWLGQADGSFVGNYAAGVLSLEKAWHVVGTGDFNGDGRDDVLWRNDNGVLTNWLGQANGSFVGNYANSAYQVDDGWLLALTGDIDGDKRDDIVWRTAEGAVLNWFAEVDGGFLTGGSASFSIDSSWHVVPGDLFVS